MTEREEGKQNPITHEGAPSDGPSDSNEHADEAVEVMQPDGETPAPRSP